MIFYKTVVYAAHPPYSTEVHKYDGPLIAADNWEDAKVMCRNLYPYAQITGETEEYFTNLINSPDEHQ
jgi:hypothetical protein